MTAQWYALQSQPRKEEVLWRQLLAKGINVFYPCIQVNPVNPRSRTMRAYFPGYVFVELAPEQLSLSTFRWMPHAYGLVCFGGVPAAVPDALVDALRRRLREIAQAGGELFHQLKTGDAITIKHGPFTGYEGIFDARLGGGERVRVLLKMLSERYVPMELCVGQIQPR